jgi:hypothetical protein
MTGTNCDLFTHNQSRSYLNHLVFVTSFTYCAVLLYCVLDFYSGTFNIKLLCNTLRGFLISAIIYSHLDYSKSNKLMTLFEKLTFAKLPKKFPELQNSDYFISKILSPDLSCVAPVQSTSLYRIYCTFQRPSSVCVLMSTKWSLPVHVL